MLHKHNFQNFKKHLIEVIKNPFWHSRYNIFILLTSLLLNLGIWLFLYFKFPPSEFPVPIHFNIYFGIDVIDNWTKVFLIPELGLTFIFINLILAYIIFSSEKFISYFLFSSSLFIQILLFLATISTVIIR